MIQLVGIDAIVRRRVSSPCGFCARCFSSAALMTDGCVIFFGDDRAERLAGSGTVVSRCALNRQRLFKLLTRQGADAARESRRASSRRLRQIPQNRYIFGNARMRRQNADDAVIPHEFK